MSPLADRATAEPAMPEHGSSMRAVVVIAVAVAALAFAAFVGTEVVLRALGRASFISEFVGSPSANPGYIYDLILIAIAVLGASLGLAFLLVSAIIGVRLERQQGIVLGTDAGAVDGRAAVVSRFAPPASTGPAPPFTPPGAPGSAVR
ncbi:hypothetical protein BHD05_03355 [Marisediminicola antarctica]|uniref:Uncharacterized protein n=1 Tax=Marisediminicola antarctica TaxID=674079 RepID=A0A7L5AEK4_9MICO|nr:hypothetical protein BHD05_03355 [Marisediminicola antarctica]